MTVKTASLTDSLTDFEVKVSQFETISHAQHCHPKQSVQ